MKKNVWRIMLIIVFLFSYLIINTKVLESNNKNVFSIPGLPRPIGKEPVIITSAGQSTNTYIIKDISNRLMLRSYFLPQAKSNDLKEAKTIVFSIDYSPLSLKLQGKKYEEEKERIKELVDKADHIDMKIVSIVFGGKKQNKKENIELLDIVLPKSDYIIGVKESYCESYIIQIAKDNDIQITLVDGVKAIYEPFASIFR
ncbi:DUF6305 family protein [Lutispora thermophila]|mgnify:CR=1 FL=1|uniref:DUF6305 domain-containing protein n=1 Tax=Lutispora thermophila DSM 19022 TaxID=1122184 RepID=A0A1M6GNG0_9FIRM|nr:DUF6305 family protein [Lutispora thermophila]SHJ11420.1 hypothetical protein SAMN02745176_02445 [Lutispora thermophila DSM 19022]